MHDFRESLRRSHSASDLPFWGEVYAQAFPGYLSMIDHRQDGEHQRAGIDRSLIMPNSKQILVDEKARFKPYPDIALEFLSDAERNAPGWVCKPLRADFIAYAICPLGRAYVLPVPQLQSAWAEHGGCWRKAHGVRRTRSRAAGRTWTTLFVPVPVPDLFRAIGAALRAQFAPYIPNAPAAPKRPKQGDMFGGAD